LAPRVRRSCGRRPTSTGARGTAPGARRAEAGSQRSSLLFQCDGHGPTAKALVQDRRPRPRCLWRVVDEALISFPTVGGLENQACFLAAQSRARNAAQTGSGVVTAVSTMTQTPLRRGWLGSGEVFIVKSRNGKSSEYSFLEPSGIPPFERSRSIALPDTEIRSGGMPAPTKVVANVWSVGKPPKLHRALGGKIKKPRTILDFFSGETIRHGEKQSQRQNRSPRRWRRPRRRKIPAFGESSLRPKISAASNSKSPCSHRGVCFSLPRWRQPGTKHGRFRSQLA